MAPAIHYCMAAALLVAQGCSGGPWAEWEADRPVRERLAAVAELVEDASVPASPVVPVEPVGGRVRVVITPQVLVVDTTTWEEEAPWARHRELAHDWRVQRRLLTATPVPVDDGLVPDDHKRGQMISHLYDDLLRAAEVHKDIGRALADRPEWEFRGDIEIVAHPDTPWATLREVAFTAGQAQFGRFHLAVEGGTLDWVTPGDQRWSLLIAADGSAGIDRHVFNGGRGGNFGSLDRLGLVLGGDDIVELEEPPPPPPEPPRALLVPADQGSLDVAAVSDALARLSELVPEPDGVVVFPHSQTPWRELVAASSLNRSSPQVAVLSGWGDSMPGSWTTDLAAFAPGLGPVPALMLESPTLAHRVETAPFDIDAPHPMWVQDALEQQWGHGEPALTLTSLRGCVLPVLAERAPSPGRLHIELSTRGPVTRVWVDEGPLADTGVAACLKQAWQNLPTGGAAPATGPLPMMGRSSAIPPAVIRWVVDIDGGGVATPRHPADPALVAELLAGPDSEASTSELEGLATSDGPLLARGHAVQALGLRTDGTSALERLAEHAEPELVRLWAAGALLSRVDDADGLIALAPLADRYPGLHEGFHSTAVRVVADVAAQLELVRTSPSLSEPLQPMLLRAEPAAVVDVALRHPDPGLRRLASQVIGARSDVVDAWVDAIDPDQRRSPPWSGGPLFLPTLQRDDARTAQAFEHIARWWIRCERQCTSQQSSLRIAVASLSASVATGSCWRLEHPSGLEECIGAEATRALLTLEGR